VDSPEDIKTGPKEAAEKMPAGVWAVPFSVGGRAHSKESEL